MSLLAKRLLIVSGKGGVGKSTVSAALGLAAAARGRRCAVVEVSGQHRIASMFGLPGGSGAPRPVAPNLETLSVDPQRALEQELRAGLPVKLLAGPLVESRAVGTIAQAAPGLRELLTLTVVRDLLAGHHDLVVLDAPATGHAIGMLEVPATVAGIARVGPVRQRADSLRRLLEDPQQTGVILVTTPEELAVAETLEATDRLAAARVELAGLVVNCVLPPLFEPGDAEVLGRVGEDAGPLARAAAEAAAVRIARTAAERDRLAWLPAPVAELPALRPADGIGRDELTELALLLEGV